MYYDFNTCVNRSVCPVCQRNAEIHHNRDVTQLYVDCTSCGTYHITRALVDDRFECSEGQYELDKLSAYLYYNHTKIKSDILISDRESSTDYFRITPNLVNNWYPKTFSEKVDLILLKLDELSAFTGDCVNVSNGIDQLMFCVNAESSSIQKGNENKTQIAFMEEFLTNQNYIHDLHFHKYQLLPRGIDRVYELQKTLSVNKNVFISMAFNKDTNDTREAIRMGVINAGYSPEYIDEIIHNHQIMPEMFRLIRESKFLILEISEPNYGAYYEAGYALGLGKEVIICCSDEVFRKEYITEEEKRYAKYLKPHFDIAQKQLLIWSDYNDLTKKLTEWIKAIVG